MNAGRSHRYYYRSEGKEDGPVSGDKLLELFETHMITAFDEVRRDGETNWVAVQQVVTAILESSKGGARNRSKANDKKDAPKEASGLELGGEDDPASVRQQNMFVAQRGAPAPKAAGSISDEDLAQSIAYATKEVNRGWAIRGAFILVVFVALGIGGVRYSANLRGAAPAVDVPFRVETQLSLDGGTAATDRSKGSGVFSLSRVRDVTFGADDTVSMLTRESSSRWRADFSDGPDYSELKHGALRGQNVTFTSNGAGWDAALSGATATSKQANKLGVIAFDNAVFYQDRRMWPWPWQSRLVNEPQSCSVLALDFEGCKAEIRVRFVGFAACGGDRCARLTIDGDWDGIIDGDNAHLKLQGEILRSLVSGLDVSIQAAGDMAIRRTIKGPSSTLTISLNGPVTYSQTTTLAE